jgi:hypothetical protein
LHDNYIAQVRCFAACEDTSHQAIAMLVFPGIPA